MPGDPGLGSSPRCCAWWPGPGFYPSLLDLVTGTWVLALAAVSGDLDLSSVSGLPHDGG